MLIFPISLPYVSFPCSFSWTSIPASPLRLFPDCIILWNISEVFSPSRRFWTQTRVLMPWFGHPHNALSYGLAWPHEGDGLSELSMDRIRWEKETWSVVALLAWQTSATIPHPSGNNPISWYLFSFLSPTLRCWRVKEMRKDTKHFALMGQMFAPCHTGGTWLHGEGLEKEFHCTPFPYCTWIQQLLRAKSI